MALNYSHRPLSPAHISEDHLASPMRIVNGYILEGNPENCWKAYDLPRQARQGEAEYWNINSVREGVDGCGSSESISRDIIDLLPDDPFGMGIETTFTTITGLLERFHVANGEYMRSNKTGAIQDDYGLPVDWDLIWNNALKAQTQMDNGMQLFTSYRGNEESEFHHFMSSFQSAENLNVSNNMTQVIEGALHGNDLKLKQTCNFGDTVGSDSELCCCSDDVQIREEVDGAATFEEAPHEALFYALSYLGVKDLLSVERACKSLCSAVQGDPLLWRSIYIDQSLNDKITDAVLVQLTSRAQGNLQCLSLVECVKVTLDGLRRVLETNPRLTKLCVPGCTRLSVEGILDIIRTHNSKVGVLGIKLIRISGLNIVKSEHIEDLKLLLGVGRTHLQSSHRPHYRRWGNDYLPSDDDRAIDIEQCPRCEKFKMVFDCPAEGCQVKDRASSLPCRACKICIPRCDHCGTCINERVFEETFNLDNICADCSRLMTRFQGQDRQDEPRGTIHEPVQLFISEE